MKTSNGVGPSDLASHRSSTLLGWPAYLALTSGLGRDGARFPSGGAAPLAVGAKPATAVRVIARRRAFTCAPSSKKKLDFSRLVCSIQHTSVRQGGKAFFPS